MTQLLKGNLHKAQAYTLGYIQNGMLDTMAEAVRSKITANIKKKQEFIQFFGRRS